MKLFHPTTPDERREIQDRGFRDTLHDFGTDSEGRLTVRVAVAFTDRTIDEGGAVWVEIDLPDSLATAFEDSSLSEGFRTFYVPAAVANYYRQPPAPLELRLTLSPPVFADFQAVASHLGRGVSELIEEVLREWVGPQMATTKNVAGGPDAQRQQAAGRLALLRQWNKLGRPVGGFNGVSRATFFRWELRFQGHGLAGLVDGRAGGKGSAPAFPQFYAELDRARAACKRKPKSASALYRQVCVTAKEKGWPTPSERAARRHLASTR